MAGLRLSGGLYHRAKASSANALTPTRELQVYGEKDAVVVQKMRKAGFIVLGL